MTFGGRQPSMEDNHRWKTTICGRRPSVKDDLGWKMTFIRRRPWVEDDLQWKMTHCRRWPLLKENLRWKTICGGRRPSVENDLHWKMTSVADNLRWKMTFSGSLHAAYYALCFFSLSCLLASQIFLDRITSLVPIPTLCIFVRSRDMWNHSSCPVSYYFFL